MQHSEALSFLEPAQITPGTTWADLGAGSGTFSLAIAHYLGSEGTVYAIDKRTPTFPTQQSEEKYANIIQQAADFTKELHFSEVDGILMANSLHYVRRPIPVLKRILTHLRPGGVFLLIEYDRRRGNPWVPYPIAEVKWPAITAQVGLSDPVVLHRRTSSYGQGNMYLVESVKRG